MNKLFAYLVFVIFGAWITCAVLLSSPSDPKNAIAFGYSLELILIASSLILFTFPLLFLTYKLVKDPQISQRLEFSLLNNNTLYYITILSSFFFLLLLLLPSYRLGDFASYVSRLYSILIWLTIVAWVTLGLFVNFRKSESLSKFILDDKNTLRIGVIAFAIFVVLLLIISITGIGIRQPEDYWFGAGVPVLGLQVLLALTIGIVFVWFEPKLKTNHLDLILGICIFAITAFLWAGGPVLPNYFMPDTAKNVMYPYSDSAVFDTGSQFALIGEGLFNGKYFDRILYTSFLTYLHIFAGQDIETMLMVQAIVFSIFPVILYLIGKELYNRTFGLVIASIISLRGVNAILSATWIDLASPKIMTTDFATAIGIALFLLFAIKWLKNTSKLYFIIFAGGALGLSMMLRTHVLFLALAFIAFILILGFQFDWKYKWVASLALILGMLAATTPWDIRNLSNGKPMFYLYYYRIQLILEERYNVEDVPSSFEPTPIHARVIHRDELGCDGQACKIVNHFVHNLIASFLFLPSSFEFDGLWNTVKEGAPFWKIAWKGSGIQVEQWFFIILNFVFASLGIGIAWSKHKWLGLLPIIIFISYMAANALGLTSAGRYVAPTDWIICLYYALGIYQVTMWLIHWVKIMPMEQNQVEVKYEAFEIKSIQYHGVVFSLIFILGIGSLIPLVEMPFEERYQVRAPEKIFAELQEKNLLEQSGFSENDLLEFLSQPRAMMIEGRVLYPRYYEGGDGEPDRSTYYRYLDYSRSVFTVIGPYALEGQGVVIAGDKPNFELHTSDVIVLGCWNRTYYAPFLDAVVVYVLGDENYVYTRNPMPELTCPIPEP